MITKQSDSVFVQPQCGFGKTPLFVYGDIFHNEEPNEYVGRLKVFDKHFNSLCEFGVNRNYRVYFPIDTSEVNMVFEHNNQYPKQIKTVYFPKLPSKIETRINPYLYFPFTKNHTDEARNIQPENPVGTIKPENGFLSGGYLEIPQGENLNLNLNLNCYSIETFFKKDDANTDLFHLGNFTFSITSDKIKIGNKTEWIIEDDFINFRVGAWVQFGLFVYMDKVKLYVNGVLVKSYSIKIPRFETIALSGGNSFQHFRFLPFYAYHANYPEYTDFSKGALHKGKNGNMATMDMLNVVNFVDGFVNTDGTIRPPDYQNMCSDFVPVFPELPYSYSVSPTRRTNIWVGISEYDKDKKHIKRNVFYVLDRDFQLDAKTRYIRIGSRYLANGGSMSLRSVVNETYY